MGTIDYPEWFPLPQKPGKAMTFDAGFRTDQPQVGAPIFQKLTDDIKVAWSLKWIFTLDQERAFQQWLRSPNKSVINSYGSQASGNRSAVINSFNCRADREGSTVLSSTITRSGEQFEVCGGYGGTTEGNPLSSNRKISLNMASGNIRAAGTITNGATFADYAEYFENAEIGVIPLGTLVELNGDKVKCANGDDVSGTAGVTLNSAALAWGNKYLTGPHGEPVFEYAQGVKVRVKNPDYQPTLEQIGTDENGEPVFDVSYTTREERPEEWSCIGMMGQVFVNVAPDVKIGD